MFKNNFKFLNTFFLQFDEPTEDLPEFVAEEEAGFKGWFTYIHFFNIKSYRNGSSLRKIRF